VWKGHKFSNKKIRKNLYRQWRRAERQHLNALAKAKRPKPGGNHAKE